MLTRFPQAKEYSWVSRGDPDELVDSGTVTSPLDDVDEIVFFAQQLQAAAQREGEAYQQLVANLSGEERTFLQAVIQQAEKNRAESANAKS